MFHGTLGRQQESTNAYFDWLLMWLTSPNKNRWCWPNANIIVFLHRIFISIYSHVHFHHRPGPGAQWSGHGADRRDGTGNCNRTCSVSPEISIGLIAPAFWIWMDLNAPPLTLFGMAPFRPFFWGTQKRRLFDQYLMVGRIRRISQRDPEGMA